MGNRANTSAKPWSNHRSPHAAYATRTSSKPSAGYPATASCPNRCSSPPIEDRPLPIGHGQTISQPYVVALMTELADVKAGDTVLEVGTGSGYQAAVLAQLGVKVYSIEIIEPLAEQARAVLDATGYGEQVEVRTGDGYAGWPEHAPFDAVIVTAAPAGDPRTTEAAAAGWWAPRHPGRAGVPAPAADHAQRERLRRGECAARALRPHDRPRAARLKRLAPPSGVAARPGDSRQRIREHRPPMALTCGIVGLPNVGKSTLFNALTAAGIQAENYPFCTIEPNTGVVVVPDDRLAKLQAIVQSQAGDPDHRRVRRHRGPGEGRVGGRRARQPVSREHSRDQRDHPRDPLLRRRERGARRWGPRTRGATPRRSKSNSASPTSKHSRSGSTAFVAWPARATRPRAPRSNSSKPSNAHLSQGSPARTFEVPDAMQAAFMDLHLLTAKPILYVANIAEDCARRRQRPQPCTRRIGRGVQGE